MKKSIGCDTKEAITGKDQNSPVARKQRADRNRNSQGRLSVY